MVYYKLCPLRGPKHQNQGPQDQRNEVAIRITDIEDRCVACTSFGICRSWWPMIKKEYLNNNTRLQNRTVVSNVIPVKKNKISIYAWRTITSRRFQCRFNSVIFTSFRKVLGLSINIKRNQDKSYLF